MHDVKLISRVPTEAHPNLRLTRFQADVGLRPLSDDCCVCIVGYEYWNSATDPIDANVAEDPDIDGNWYWEYSTQTGRFLGKPPTSVAPDGAYRGGVRPHCIRVLIYDNVQHNDITYSTMTTPTVLGPYMGGTAVPDENKFNNSCWNYYNYRYAPNITPARYYKSGLSYSFTVDAQRLFDALRPDLNNIPSGKPHQLALFCVVYKLQLWDPDSGNWPPKWTWYDYGNVKIFPRARYFPCIDNEEE